MFVVSVILKVWTAGLLYTSDELSTSDKSSVWVDPTYTSAFQVLGISGTSATAWAYNKTLDLTENAHDIYAMDINEAKVWKLDLCSYNILDYPFFTIALGYYVNIDTTTYPGKQDEMIGLLNDNINVNWQDTSTTLTQVSHKNFVTANTNFTINATDNNWQNQENCNMREYKPTVDNTAGCWITVAIGGLVSFVVFLILKLMMLLCKNKYLPGRKQVQPFFVIKKFQVRFHDVRANEKALVQHDLIQCFDEVVK